MRKDSMIRSSLEKKFQKILLYSGIKPPRRGCNKMLGRPDFVCKKRKLVIFIDGAFFHSNHPNHKKMKKSSEMLRKIQSQKRRDKIITKHYKSNGWNVLRVSEEEIVGHPEYVANAYRVKS